MSREGKGWGDKVDLVPLFVLMARGSVCCREEVLPTMPVQFSHFAVFGCVLLLLSSDS